MAQLKEIRNRIASIKNTRQVTNAMKMVSAAKLKKAQDSIVKILPYDNQLHKILLTLNTGDVDFDSGFFTNVEAENILIVIIGSNRGLCGGFNSNIAKTAMQHVLDNYNTQFKKGNVQFLLIGHQLEKYFKNLESNIIGASHNLLNDISYKNVSEISQLLMTYFTDKKYQRIDLVYNKFKNAAVQLLTCEQFLPLEKPKLENIPGSKPFFLFEPTQAEIMKELLPKSLTIQLFRILLDSNTAEQGARMTAMHQATDNATELMKDLKTIYNNARQAAITNEIMEITAGAEALK